MLESMIPALTDVVGASFICHRGLEHVPDVRREARRSTPEPETTLGQHSPERPAHVVGVEVVDHSLELVWDVVSQMTHTVADEVEGQEREAIQHAAEVTDLFIGSVSCLQSLTLDAAPGSLSKVVETPLKSKEVFVKYLCFLFSFCQ